MRATVKVLNSGRVTIPSAIRESMGLSEGDVVEIDVRQPGVITPGNVTVGAGV